MGRTYSLLIGLGAVLALAAGLAFLMAAGPVAGFGLLGLALVLLLGGGIGLAFTND